MDGFPYSVAIELSATLALWTALSVWQRDGSTPGGRWFGALSLSVLVWCVGEMLATRGLVDPHTRAAIIYLGILTVPPFFLAVAAHAAAVPIVRRMPWFPLGLCLPGVFLYGLLFMGPWGDLFLVFDHDRSHEGPLFQIYVWYGYLLVLLGILLFALAGRRWPRAGQLRRFSALAVGVLIPVAGNALYLYSDLRLSFDPTPVLLGVASVPLRAAIFRGGLFDVLPIDQGDLVRRVPVGLVIADELGGVIQVNAAAERLGISGERALGRSLDAVLAQLPEVVEARVSDFDLGGGHALRCAVLLERLPREPARAA